MKWLGRFFIFCCVLGFAVDLLGDAAAVLYRPPAPKAGQPVHFTIPSYDRGRVWNTGGGTDSLLAPLGQRWVEIQATFIVPQFPAGSSVSIWPGIQGWTECPATGCLVQAGIGSGRFDSTWTENWPVPITTERPVNRRAGQIVSIFITRIEPGEWRVEIKNVSTGASWSGDEKWSCGSCQIAETAVEALPNQPQLRSPVRWLSAWAVTNTGKRWAIR